MSTARALHNEAIQLAQRAMISRHKGDLESAEALAQEAFELEAKAVELLPRDQESEPTLSILCQSAASLALQARRLAEAQRFAARGLAGYPPARTATDLLQLLEEITFQATIQQQELKLEKEDLELSLQGPSVGYGIVFYKDFVDRLQTATRLIERTAQRLTGGKYTARGPVAREHYPFTLLLAALQPGSFSVTIRLSSSESKTIPLFLSAGDVLAEVLDGIEFVDADREDELRKHIDDEAYFRNFVSLAREVAPDGERICRVQFRTSTKSVPFLRTRKSISIKMPEPQEEAVPEEVVVRGMLDFATHRKGENEIGLTTADGSEYDVEVEAGMDDLVRSYFNRMVEVAGVLEHRGRRRYLLLSEIAEVDE